MIARRSILATMLAAMAAGAGARSAGAQDRYPSKPVRLVIPFPPGGGADAVARPLAPLMTETLGQPIVLDNRGGANGNIAAEIVAKASPDGYTLLLANSSLTISGGLYRTLPFNPLADFTPISLVGVTPSLLAVNPSVPARTVKEFVELAKARPGKLSYGSSGIGSTMHLGAALLQSMAGLDMVHVPYKGGGPAIADALSGQTDFIFVNPVAVLAQVRAGKLARWPSRRASDWRSCPMCRPSRNPAIRACSRAPSMECLARLACRARSSCGSTGRSWRRWRARSWPIHW